MADTSKSKRSLEGTVSRLSGDNFGPEFKPGDIVGEYSIIRHLGDGGMGSVYLAENSIVPSLRVAMKFVQGDKKLYTTEMREMWMREAMGLVHMMKDPHPNLVQVHGVGVHSYSYGTEKIEVPYITMDFIEGKPLDSMMSATPPDDRLLFMIRAARGVGEGLNRIHEKGLVHRDIKPANILITNQNIAKIVDFGIVKLQGVPGIEEDGTILGTPGYIAPEALEGFVIPAGDMWSLGMTLYGSLGGIHKVRSLKSDEGYTGCVPHDISKAIDSRYSPLFPTIEHLLNRNHKERPTAKSLVGALKALEQELVGASNTVLGFTMEQQILADAEAGRMEEKEFLSKYGDGLILVRDDLYSMMFAPTNVGTGKRQALEGIPGLYVLSGSDTFDVGRDQDAYVTIPRKTVSRKHASISRVGDAWIYSDAGSVNGTIIGHKRVRAGDVAYLSDDTLIDFGEHVGFYALRTRSFWQNIQRVGDTKEFRLEIESDATKRVVLKPDTTKDNNPRTPPNAVNLEDSNTDAWSVR